MKIINLIIWGIVLIILVVAGVFVFLNLNNEEKIQDNNNINIIFEFNPQEIIGIYDYNNNFLENGDSFESEKGSNNEFIIQSLMQRNKICIEQYKRTEENYERIFSNIDMPNLKRVEVPIEYLFQNKDSYTNCFEEEIGEDYTINDFNLITQQYYDVKGEVILKITLFD